jgi:hypothetical protein
VQDITCSSITVLLHGIAVMQFCAPVSASVAVQLPTSHATACLHIESRKLCACQVTVCVGVYSSGVQL